MFGELSILTVFVDILSANIEHEFWGTLAKDSNSVRQNRMSNGSEALLSGRIEWNLANYVLSLFFQNCLKIYIVLYEET